MESRPLQKITHLGKFHELWLLNSKTKSYRKKFALQGFLQFLVFISTSVRPTLLVKRRMLINEAENLE